MAAHRRNGAPWLITATFLVSAVGHVGGGAVYYFTRPEPPARLTIKKIGNGEGRVLSSPAGIACGSECQVGFKKGTRVTLMAVRGEGNTFEGWPEPCEVADSDPFECSLTVVENTTIEVGFGLVPEQIEVAWVETPQPEKKQKKPTEDPLTITLPDVTEEALKVMEPLPPPEIGKKQPPPVQQPVPQPTPPILQPKPPPPPEKLAEAEVKKKPEKVQPPQQNLTSVEVPDENQVDKAPDDARHLSDKNRDVAEETHAQQTNLERAADGKSVASEKSDIRSDEVGGKEDKIAQLEDSDPSSLEADRGDESTHNGKDEIAAGARSGDEGDDGEKGQEGRDEKARDRGLLAMRGLTGRAPPGGPVVAEDPEKGMGGKKGRRGKEGRTGIKTQLEYDDYKRIVGADVADKEVEVARRRTSHRRGRWQRKQAAVRAAIENFTPHVKPGNQTALKTRAAPFAVYIARMHRRIHELWGFGFLTWLDGKPRTHPLNDWSLATKIEIIINPDGTIHKTNIVTPSGKLDFDVAALDVIYNSGPFEPPPEKIRSPDGRAYMHWAFHRNEYQCGTFNVQPFILTDDAVKLRDRGADAGQWVRDRVDKRRQRNGDSSASNPGVAASSEDVAASSALAHANLPAPDDPRAQLATEIWLRGFTTGDVGKMVSVSAGPFRSGDRVVAQSPNDLDAVYGLVMNEAKSRKVLEWKVLSEAGYRKRFGAVPPGVAGTGQLLVFVRLRGESLTLVLQQTADGLYRVVGLHR